MSTHTLDFESSDFIEDPYPAYQALRAHGRVVQDDRGFWVIARYSDCEQALRDRRWGHADRDPALASTSQAPAMRVRVFPDLNADPWPFMRLNPPDHTRLRRLVNKAFMARPIGDFAPRVTALAVDLIDEAAERGAVDLVRDFAAALPIRSICARLGVPAADWIRLRDWSMEFSRGFDPGFAADSGQFERCEQAAYGLRDYFADLIRQRQRNPADDLLSELVKAREGGDFLSDEELIVTVAMLLSAGNETSISLLGNGVLTLLRHPGRLAWLRDHPEADALAVEELLRFDSPFQFADRIALESFELSGVTIEAGDRVLILVGSANRDPEAFYDPDTLDLTRNPNRHLSFGGGLHFCIGAQLARLQATTALRSLLDRVDLTLTEAPQRDGTAWNRGLKSFPVVLSRWASRS